MDRQIAEMVHTSPTKIIVLDDDPTGMQTVHGITMLTVWDDQTLIEAFQEPEALFYILTNSRSYDEAVVTSMLQDITERLLRISKQLGIEFVVISRGDSTLRGHYPLEIDLLSAGLGADLKFDAHLMIPAFFEGNRITENNTHFLIENNQKIPVHQTEFAKDPTFGYHHSYLPDWVEEKTKGRIKAENVLSITLEDIRVGGWHVVYEKLIGVKDGLPVIVNAANYDDLQVFTLGLLRAEQAGKRFLYRTGASFVKVRAAISDRPFLSAKEMINEDAIQHGGIVFVGSHVKKTTNQLHDLIQSIPALKTIELNVEEIIDPEQRSQVIAKILLEMNDWVKNGKNVVVYTSRKLIQTEGKSENLGIARSVSDAMVEVVQGMEFKPAFIIAKGGITSNDIASRGLGIRVAKVLGQVEKGIPVWKCGQESRFPDMPYVVFPGNVGEADTLSKIVKLCIDLR